MLYYSNYMTFWKRQNYGGSKKNYILYALKATLVILLKNN